MSYNKETKKEKDVKTAKDEGLNEAQKAHLKKMEELDGVE